MLYFNQPLGNAFTIRIVFVGIKKSTRNHKMTSLGFITLTGRWCFLRKFSHPHTSAGNIGFWFLNYWYQKFLNFELQILIIMIIKLMIILSSDNLISFSWTLVYKHCLYPWAFVYSIYIFFLCNILYIVEYRSMQAYFEQWLSLMLRWDSQLRGGGRDGRPHCFHVLDTMLNVKVRSKYR